MLFMSSLSFSLVLLLSVVAAGVVAAATVSRLFINLNKALVRSAHILLSV